MDKENRKSKTQLNFESMLDSVENDLEDLSLETKVSLMETLRQELRPCSVISGKYEVLNIDSTSKPFMSTGTTSSDKDRRMGKVIVEKLIKSALKGEDIRVIKVIPPKIDDFYMVHEFEFIHPRTFETVNKIMELPPPYENYETRNEKDDLEDVLASGFNVFEVGKNQQSELDTELSDMIDDTAGTNESQIVMEDQYDNTDTPKWKNPAKIGLLELISKNNSEKCEENPVELMEEVD